jgi:hypothetical protein
VAQAKRLDPRQMTVTITITPYNLHVTALPLDKRITPDLLYAVEEAMGTQMMALWKGLVNAMGVDLEWNGEMKIIHDHGKGGGKGEGA